MKKLLLIISIVLCVSVSVFADGFIGVETGLDINWMKEKQSGHDTGDTSTMSLAVGAAGVHYFTDSIGLGYGLGMEFPLLWKWEDSDYQDIENAANVFKGDLSFQFKHDFSEKMALEAGVGMYVLYSWQDIGRSSSRSYWQFGAQGNIGISYKILSSLAFRAGTRIYTPFNTSAKAESFGYEIDYDWTQTGIGLVPYIGLAYAY